MNIDDRHDRVAKFYMINMALLCFLSCNFGTDWLKNEENTARPILFSTK